MAADDVGSGAAGQRDAATSRAALFDFACDRLAFAIAEKSEAIHRTELPGWVRICNAHPTRSECLRTAALIRIANKASPLDCEPGNTPSADISASFLPFFDQVCANVAATWLGNAEVRQQADVAGWVKTCNAHPDVSVCKGTNELIDKHRKVRPLDCGSGGS